MKQPQTKSDLVRKALAKLGLDAKPLEIQAHIRKRFKAEVATTLIGVVKANERRRATGTTAAALSF